MNKSEKCSLQAIRQATVGLTTLLLLATTGVNAALTDLANRPLNNGGAVQIKPNIMLLLDTSNSMRRTHMPDELETSAATLSLGYKAYQCNVLYYNPTQRYALPKNADGTLFAAPSFVSAKYDGFDGASANVNLSAAFRAYDNATRQYSVGADPTQAAYYYLHSSGQTFVPTAAPCNDVDTDVSKVATTSPTGVTGNWVRVLVSATSGPAASDERQNFANWYSYYRTRINLAKSAVSLAFTPLTNSYRVGFVTMRPGTPVAAANYLAIDDFNTVQRTAWFNKLFTQVPGGSSPAREGLARVGRHYAGKQDGINDGMTGDPIQYSCQQNFTIATTDGYWNTAAETAGPVKIDGVTLVGQQDGTLTDNNGNTPRPMWDGTNDTTRVVTDKDNIYSYAPCTAGWFNLSTLRIDRNTFQALAATSQLRQSTVQNLQSSVQRLVRTTQNLQSTLQTTQSTLQNRESTNQNLQSTIQHFQTTAQITSSTLQRLQSTNQNRESTNQNLQSTTRQTATTTQFFRTTQQVTQSTVQNRQSTTQNLQSTSQITQSTAQTLRATFQNLRRQTQTTLSTSQLTRNTVQTLQSTTQNRQSTTQTTQSTSQLTRSTSQVTASTSQNNRATTQITQSTLQLRQSTSQVLSCSAITELCTPVLTCSAGGAITCSTLTTGPTLVASCTPAVAAAGNTFTATTCASSPTGPTAVASCTPALPVAGNSFTATTCGTNNTPATPVASCTASGPTAGNSYTTTTCSVVPGGPTPVASCSVSGPTAGNSFTSTTCATIPTGPTGVASCTAAGPIAGNAFTTTTCATPTTGPTGVSSCSPTAAGAGNSYVATTCGTNNTTNVFVATCTASGPTAGNGFTTTTCPAPIVSGPTAVASCTAAAAAAGNSFVTTTCTPNNTGPSGVASCTPVTAAAGNSWQAVTCATLTTGPNGVTTCTNDAPNGGNSYVQTICNNLDSTFLPQSSCTASGPTAGNSYVTTTCSTNNTAAVGVAAPCTTQTATAGNSWVSATCTPNNTGPTGVSSCMTILPVAGNAHTSTTCGAVNSGPTPIATCTASGPTAGNSYVNTTCTTNNTTNVFVATCTPSGPTLGNGYTTTTCPASITTTNVPVSTCTPSGANAGNSFTTTTCVGPTVITGPIAFDPAVCAVQAAAPLVGPNFYATICPTTVSGAVPVASCVNQTANAGNNWTQIVCNTIATTSVPVVTCTASGPTMANNFTTTTCPAPIVTTNVPVVSCTATAANAGNSFTSRTCPAPIVTTSVPVLTCTASAANAGNTFTSTTCVNNTTGPTGVASCVNIAAAGPAFVATTCGTNNLSNTPIPATCVASGPTAANFFTTTTCPTAPTITTNVPVVTCTAALPIAGNSFTTTTCPAPITTTNVPVLSCTATAANAGNSFTSKTCSPVTTGPFGVATCGVIAPTALNTWTATSCGTNNTTNVAVQTCTAAPATASNSWTIVGCPAPLTTGPTAVSACTGGNAPQTAAAGNSWVTRTCDTLNAATNYVNQPVATCTAQTATGGNSWITLTCPAAVTTTNVPVASCSAGPATAGNSFVTTSCNTATTPPTPVATCTAASAGAGNSFTATTCTSATSGPTAVATCTAAVPIAGNAFTQTSCSNVTTGPTLTQTCTPAAASVGNGYTATSCVSVPGQKQQYVTTTTVTTSQYSGGFITGTPTVVTTSDPVADLDGVCYVPGVAALASPPSPGKPGLSWVNGLGATVTLPPAPTAPCLAWPCTASVSLGGGIANSLADVAQYYYVTDLRDTMENNVPATGNGPEDDRVTHQHMTTFTIALGVSGLLNYRNDYRNVSTTVGDFADIRTGARNWPFPLADQPSSIDDFWHAAVNGRGQYFSAGNPTSVINGLGSALAGVTARTGAGSAAASSSTQEPTTATNFAYQAQYTTQEWSGDLISKERDLTTGTLRTGQVWSAKGLLDARAGNACDTRNIYLFRAGATNNIAPFTWNTRLCDGSGNPTGGASTGLNAAEQAYFNATNVSLLSQYPSMTDGTSSTVNQRAIAPGANLLNFVRGHRGLEDFVANDLTKLYRKRRTILGDIVGSQPSYLKGDAATDYVDAGYAAFKASTQSRTGMVYVGSNGGMLHAFRAGEDVADTEGGKEEWAFVPTAVMPNLYRIADSNYANSHIFTVDGSPTVFSAYDGSSWKSVLVGGLAGGGKGYYALDVTNPASPKALWEFNWSDTCYSAGSPATHGADCHIGYTYGKPKFGKLSDGTWVVFASSGYNNVNSPAKVGDGDGYLYIINAFTGKIIKKISTGVGNAGNPSGLAPIAPFADDPVKSALVLRVYGADLEGNIWRFETSSAYTATKIGTAKDSGGTRQPITTVMPVQEINGKIQVMVGTGRLLGITDLPDTQVQTIYSILDTDVGSPVYPDLRASLTPITLTQAGSGSSRTVSAACNVSAAQCVAPYGWYADLPVAGERLVVDMKQASGTLVAATSLLDSNPCNAGGTSQIYQFNVLTGLDPSAPRDAPPGTSFIISRGQSAGLAVGVTIARLLGGGLIATVTTVQGELPGDNLKKTLAPKGTRITWREVMQ